MKSQLPIIGHEAQIAELQSNIKTGNVAHAYLFVGSPHLGKMTVATWFARALLLQRVPPEEREECERLMDRLLHPDLLILDRLWIEEVCEDWHVIAKRSNVPQEHRSRPPRARTDTIGIDDVRAIQDRLYGTGTGIYRCCIIRSVERMQEEAANALLKILEEPPVGRVFLLTTHTLAALLPTVISRTRVMHFSPISPKIMAPLLAGMATEEQQFLLHCAQGAPGMLCTLRNDPDALRRERMLQSKAIAFFTSPLSEQLKILGEFLEQEQELRAFLFHLTWVIREHPPSPLLHWTREITTLLHNVSLRVNRPLAAQRFVLQTARGSAKTTLL